MTTKIYKNLIGGKWVNAESGKTFLNHNPANIRRRSGRVSGLRRGGRRSRGQGRPGSLSPVAAGPCPQTGRNALPHRRVAAAAQRGAGPADDARDGQGLERDAGRCAGSCRHCLLHGGRGAQAVRSDDAFGAARQIRHVGPHARGGLRHDHALELPHGHPVLEAVSRPGLRQYLRHQAGGRHSPVDHQPGGTIDGGWTAGRRGQHCHRLRPGCRGAPGGPSRCGRHFVYRFE